MEAINTRMRSRATRSKGLVSLASSLAILMHCSLSHGTTTTNGGQAYVDECESAGVPIPPTFNYELAWHGFSDWTKVGVQTVNFAGGSIANQITEVFYYQTGQGVCIALPRSQFPPGQTPEQGPPDNVVLLGVICQGNASAKACFWDAENINPNNDVRFGDGPRPEYFVGGADIDTTTDQCTNCHLGENVFIIHPFTALAEVPNTMPSTWVDPIIPAGRNWIENIGPFDFDPSSYDFAALQAQGLFQFSTACLTCHTSSSGGRFPQVSNQTTTYCNRVLSAAFGETMPQGESAPAAPNARNPLYEELIAACSAPAPSEINPPEQMMSFDGPAEEFWYSAEADLTDEAGNSTEGDAAMAVEGSGYMWLDSLSFSTWHLPYVGTEVEIDVFVPAAGQPNPYWLGYVQLLATIPSAQMTNNFIGQVELTPGGTGWRTATFLLPSELHSALQEQHADVRFSIAVNTPHGAPAVLLDNMRLAGAISPPAGTPNWMTQYDFERGGAWTNFEGAVVAASTSGDVKFLGSRSMRIEMDGSSDGRIWVEPLVSPAPGDTVTFRVHIPSGAPISAVQPYVEDDDYDWHHSWNPNLPRDAWMPVTVTIPPGVNTPIRELGVKIYLTQPYTGPVYLDEIQW